MSGPLFQLSYSTVAAFNRCRKQYWFRKLSGFPAPPPVPTVPGCLGTGVHRAMKVLCETNDPETAARALDAYLRMPAHECVGPGTPAFDDAFQLFQRGCAAHDSIASEDRWAELDTWAPWRSRGVTVTARIDRVDRFPDGHYQIIDWKTGRYDYDDQTDAQPQPSSPRVGSGPERQPEKDCSEEWQHPDERVEEPERRLSLR